MRIILLTFLISLNLLKAQTVDEKCEYGIQSFHIVDIQSGEVLMAKNEKKVLIPASSWKVVSTLAAYGELGRNIRFSTKIGYRGKVMGGVLSGDIVIKADGDPTLGSQRIYGSNAQNELFDKIYNSIRSKKIECVDGNLVLDVSFDRDYPLAASWPANDLGNYYASGTWPLNFLENEYQLVFNTKNEIGETPKIIESIPHISGLTFNNRLKIAGSETGDQAYIYNGPYVMNKEIIGSLPQGSKSFKIRGSMPNPPMYFLDALSEYLTKKGIDFQNIELAIEEQKVDNNILVIDSPTLSEIIKLTNVHSINLYAEAVFKKYQRTLRSSSTEKAITDYCRKLGLSFEGFSIDDASGLSPQNRVSTLFFTQFLSSWIKKNGFENASPLLAQAGYEGTVARFLKEKKTQGKIWVKSGSMTGVLSYTGIMRTASNRRVAFSFIYNYCEEPKSQQKKWVEKKLLDIFSGN